MTKPKKNTIFNFAFTKTVILGPSLTRAHVFKASNTKYVFSAGPKQDLLPHTTTTHPLTVQAPQAIR